MEQKDASWDSLIIRPGEKADIRFQDGALRHAVGVHLRQVVRAGRDPQTAPDGCGWTYSHAPMLAWWRGRFFLQYLSNPVSEHEMPGQTLLAVSEDGWAWSRPEIAFAPLLVDTSPYRGPNKGLLPPRAPCVMHQRAAFFVSRGDRFLMTAFYGLSPEPHTAPNNGYGVCRVVREIAADLSLSPIYVIRWNEAGGFNAANTPVFPDYRTCADHGFVAACNELLAHPLATQQWWEEERLNTAWFRIPPGQALSCFTLPDGTVAGVFKHGRVTFSRDQGLTWSEPQPAPGLETATGKVWGQRTPDGRYALVYNPSTDGQHRWPLAVTTSDNGTGYAGLLALTPEVSPCRWQGLLKNLGPQYVRGIFEGNPIPGDDAMYLTYSVNKEDIWFGRVPVPVRGVVDEDVNDDFGGPDASSYLHNWNLSVPAWTRAELAGGALSLADRDPYDRVRAWRILKPASCVRLSFTLQAESVAPGTAILVALQDRHGSVPGRILLQDDGRILVRSGGVDNPVARWRAGAWLTCSWQADCVANRLHLTIDQDDKRLYDGQAAFSASVWQIERILFASKADLPFQTLEDCGRYGTLGDLAGADTPVGPTVLAIGQLGSKTLAV